MTAKKKIDKAEKVTVVVNPPARLDHMHQHDVSVNSHTYNDKDVTIQVYYDPSYGRHGIKDSYGDGKSYPCIVKKVKIGNEPFETSTYVNPEDLELKKGVEITLNDTQYIYAEYAAAARFYPEYFFIDLKKLTLSSDINLYAEGFKFHGHMDTVKLAAYGGHYGHIITLFKGKLSNNILDLLNIDSTKPHYFCYEMKHDSTHYHFADEEETKERLPIYRPVEYSWWLVYIEKGAGKSYYVRMLADVARYDNRASLGAIHQIGFSQGLLKTKIEVPAIITLTSLIPTIVDFKTIEDSFSTSSHIVGKSSVQKHIKNIGTTLTDSQIDPILKALSDMELVPCTKEESTNAELLELLNKHFSVEASAGRENVYGKGFTVIEDNILFAGLKGEYATKDMGLELKNNIGWFHASNIFARKLSDAKMPVPTFYNSAEYKEKPVNQPNQHDILIGTVKYLARKKVNESLEKHPEIIRVITGVEHNCVVQYKRSFYCVELSGLVDLVCTFHDNSQVRLRHFRKNTGSDRNQARVIVHWEPCKAKLGFMDDSSKNPEFISWQTDAQTPVFEHLSNLPEATREYHFGEKNFKDITLDTEEMSYIGASCADGRIALKDKQGRRLTLIPVDSPYWREPNPKNLEIRKGDAELIKLYPKFNIIEEYEFNGVVYNPCEYVSKKVDVDANGKSLLGAPSQKAKTLDSSSPQQRAKLFYVSYSVYFNSNPNNLDRFKNYRIFKIDQIEGEYKSENDVGFHNMHKSWAKLVKGDFGATRGAFYFDSYYRGWLGSGNRTDTHRQIAIPIIHAIILFKYWGLEKYLKDLTDLIAPSKPPEALPTLTIQGETIVPNNEKRYSLKLEKVAEQVPVYEKLTQLIDKPYPVLELNINLIKKLKKPDKKLWDFYQNKERLWLEKDKDAQNAFLTELGYTDHGINFSHAIQLDTDKRCSFSNSHLHHAPILNQINRRVVINKLEGIKFKNTVLTNTLFIIESVESFDMTESTVINCAFVFKKAPTQVKISQSLLNHTNIRSESLGIFKLLATHCVFNDCHIGVNGVANMDLTNSDIIFSNIKCKENRNSVIILTHAHLLRSKVYSLTAGIVTSHETINVESQIGYRKGRNEQKKA